MSEWLDVCTTPFLLFSTLSTPFYRSSTLVPGDNITLASPHTAFANLHTSAFNVSVRVALGPGLVPPTIALAAPASATVCDGVIVDAAASTGRQLRFRWTVAVVAAPADVTFASAVGAALATAASAAAAASSSGAPKLVLSPVALQPLAAYYSSVAGGASGAAALFFQCRPQVLPSPAVSVPATAMPPSFRHS
jgi:hypothetical protein